MATPQAILVDSVTCLVTKVIFGIHRVYVNCTCFLQFKLIDVSLYLQTSSRSSSPTPSSGNSNKIVFVAGATGQTGKRVVKELLMQGYEVRAGVRDIAKAKDALPKDNNLELVSFLLFLSSVKQRLAAE